MNCIGVIKDSDFGLKPKKNKHSNIRICTRGIVINDDGKIALFHKTKKNEYKLPGGGIEKNESKEEVFKREVLEETGCKIKIIKELGVFEEEKTIENTKQISYIYIAKVEQNTNELKLTSKEIEEGGKLIWVTPQIGLTLIKKSLDKLKPSKYENLYNSRFIVTRDRKILEYYIEKEKDNIWHSLYQQHIENDFKSWNDYYKTKMKLKRKFLNLVIKYSNHKPILECGCGTGKTSVYFSTLGYKTYAIDKEYAMVEQTKTLSNKICPNNMVDVIQCDIKKIPFDKKYFSVTHSSGVLEHYEDEKIIKLINEQLRVSDYCIFSVPTRYFEKKMLGNERFLKRTEWRDIISKTNGIIIKETGYHYKNLWQRIVDIIKKPKRIFKPIALYVFVLKEKDKS